MAVDQSQSAVGAQSQDISRRQERGQRILDAAATLILRWGYNKTTIDDIARQAGVAKGTIYLHWKTRDELFVALIKREKLEMGEEIKRRIATDPLGSTLQGVFRCTALALIQRPLLKAFILRDIDVLGKLAHNIHTSEAYVERLTGFITYLEYLREHQLVRTDLSIRTQVYVVSAIFMGFFLVAPLMPDGYVVSDEELATLIADTVHRTLETERAVSDGELQATSHTFMQYLDRSMAVAQEQLQQGVEARPNRDEERAT
jgi:AcrR family transcriptional regulator